ncbi:MAG: ABC transporter permease, partial [Lentisphaerae bacterium GWF2_52_8]
MNIPRVLALMKKELAAYFYSPTAYVFIVIFLLLSGFFTFMAGRFFAIGEASLMPFFEWLPWLFLVLIPAIGMHIWSDERRLGTIELLFTMPLTAAECIAGKFLAAWLFVGLALFLTFPMVLTVGYLGSPDYGVIFCGYAGSFLLAGSYLSVACLTSALSRSQVVSFILSVLAGLFLIFAGWTPVTDVFVNWAPAWLLNGIASLSFMPHIASMQRGVLDSRDLLYFASIMA